MMLCYYWIDNIIVLWLSKIDSTILHNNIPVDNIYTRPVLVVDTWFFFDLFTVIKYYCPTFNPVCEIMRWYGSWEASSLWFSSRPISWKSGYKTGDWPQTVTKKIMHTYPIKNWIKNIHSNQKLKKINR